MKRTTLLILIIVIVAGGLLATGFYFLRKNTPKYSWWPQYRYQSEQPYDIKFFYEMLKKSYGDSNFVMLNSSPTLQISDSVTNSLYFNIGFRTFYDSLTVEWFIDYVRRGNKAFFASETLPDQILEHVLGLDSTYLYTSIRTDSLIQTFFLDDSSKIYNFHFQVVQKKRIKAWYYLHDSCFNTYWFNGWIEPLSAIDSGGVNFVKIKYGRGEVYILTTPLFLTNYFMIKETGFEYANDLFGQVGKTKTLYWDNFNHFTSPHNLQDDFNPLKFFLSQKSLRWTWYLIVLMVAFFILFHLKRRQKPILIVLPDKNSSIEYAKTIGLLHYKTTSHGQLSEQLMKIFLNYIKGRYKINVNDHKEENLKIISFHSGIDFKLIQDIFSQYYLIRHDPEPLKSDTLKLYSTLEYFYKNCK